MLVGDQDFVWLCSRSHDAFWGLVKGNCPNDGARSMNQMQRALHRYAKMNPGNGKPDEIQMRAVEHLNQIYKKLWDSYRKRVCTPYQTVEKDTFEKHWHCGKHGSKLKCKAEFEAWIKANSY